MSSNNSSSRNFKKLKKKKLKWRFVSTATNQLESELDGLVAAPLRFERTNLSDFYLFLFIFDWMVGTIQSGSPPPFLPPFEFKYHRMAV